MRFLAVFLAAVLFSSRTNAQQGYEFEVYTTHLTKPRAGQIELQTNFVANGSQLTDNAEGRATHRAFRSSLEVGAGLANWLEGSAYVVGYARHGAGVDYVGNRLRL